MRCEAARWPPTCDGARRLQLLLVQHTCCTGGRGKRFHLHPSPKQNARSRCASGAIYFEIKTAIYFEIKTAIYFEIKTAIYFEIKTAIYFEIKTAIYFEIKTARALDGKH